MHTDVCTRRQAHVCACCCMCTVRRYVHFRTGCPNCSPLSTGSAPLHHFVVTCCQCALLFVAVFPLIIASCSQSPSHRMTTTCGLMCVDHCSNQSMPSQEESERVRCQKRIVELEADARELAAVRPPAPGNVLYGAHSPGAQLCPGHCVCGLWGNCGVACRSLGAKSL